MPDEPDTEDQLGPHELDVAHSLDRGRPMPAPSFRGALGRHLVGLDPGWGPRPAQLRLIVSAYLLVAVLLIGLGALIGVGAL